MQIYAMNSFELFVKRKFSLVTTVLSKRENSIKTTTVLLRRKSVVFYQSQD